MENLGGECVFASEIDPHCIETYYKNYKIDANHNVREVAAEDIPAHDVLCAGFPCQAFSKAGFQKGMSDTRGTLFFEIERILQHHKTKYIILENVRNLVSHDQGNTWKTIHSHLKALGYRLTPVPIIISPHQFGVPQLRERVVILGIYDPENADKDLQITFDKPMSKDENKIYSILDEGRVEDKYYISEKEEYVLNAWDEFYKGIKETVIGFPIWAEYFKDKDAEEDFPEWKKEFVRKNKALYMTMFNPEIIKRSVPYDTEEGCLSLLGGPRSCKRYQTIKVQWQTAEFQTRIKTFTGWTAQIIQHEIDHCNGLLI